MQSLSASRFFAALRKEYRHEPMDNEYGLYILEQHSHTRSRDLWQGHEPDVPAIRMVGDVLLNVAQMFIADMFPSRPDAMRPSAQEMQTFMEALVFLTHIVSLVSSSWRETLVDTLVEFYDRLRDAEVAGPWITSAELNGPRYPGFKAPVLQSLARMSSITITPAGHLSVFSSETASTPTELVQLAVQSFKNNPRYIRKEDRHTFIVLANNALQKSVLGTDLTVDKDIVRQLLLCIDDAARLAIELKIHNLGFYGEYHPLLETLVWFVERRNPVSVHLVPITLVEHLADNISSGLLSGEARHLVRQLRMLVTKHERSYSKMDSDATVTAHSPMFEHDAAWPASSSSLECRDKSVAESCKMSLDIVRSTSGFGIPNPIFPLTPFSLVEESRDADLELGDVSYAFPSPQLPVLSPVDTS
ncbi:hypothetical protein NM688_g9211 [Phlebia brevispora]|uniref:Uncharacterized protein n=1 Tax=Phlebia brevispora TaxID=194682 RepID=A0ACC1RKS9_9APHY|nr:hypothetical protein NM688_g9211 [Phlebia brevispora]